jgi:hypothetical protein
MTGRLGWRALLPAAALALGIGSGSVPGGAASIGTPENTQFLPVWLGPGSDALHFGAPALLNLPPGWSQGDAGVVVAPGGAWAPGARDRLVAGLLDAGAAVLELNRPREGLPGEDPLRRDLAEALATLHAGFGAGLVVLLGEGEGGEAALAVGADAAGRGRAHLAAAIRLGPEPAFLAGQVSPEEAWPARAPLLCEVLAVAQPDDAVGFADACAAGLLTMR